MDVQEPSEALQTPDPSPVQGTNAHQEGESPPVQVPAPLQTVGTAQDAASLTNQEARSVQPTGAAQAATSAAHAGDALQVEAPARRRRFRPHLRPIHIHVRVHTFDSLGYLNFRLICFTTVFSAGGLWLRQVILGWLTYDLTQSAFLTSLVMGLEAFPVLLAGPLGGLLVDRVNRRKMLVLVYAYQATVTLAFSSIVLLDWVETWHIFLYALLMGFAWATADTARTSLISNVVPRENLVNAFSLNSLAYSCTRMAMPALGGVILALVGAGPALLLGGGDVFDGRGLGAGTSESRLSSGLSYG